MTEQMSDQVLTLDPKTIQPDEYPLIVQQYQQWLADKDLNIAALNVKYAQAAGNLEATKQKAARLQEEVNVLRESAGVGVPRVAESDEPA